MERLGKIALVLVFLMGLGGCVTHGSGRDGFFDKRMYPDLSPLFEEVYEGTVLIRMLRPAVDEESKKIPEDQRRRSGSGVVISSQPAPAGGYESRIITNEHVTHGAEKITVRLYDGNSYRAKIIGFDDLYDFSLLHISTPHRLKVITLGDASKLKIGNLVYAVGNPRGWLWSLSVGFVGNLWKDPLLERIQFDGAFNPGNSGGGLFNTKGELVGIPYRIDEGGTIGFAFSVNMMKRALPALEKGGRVPHGYLGAELSDLRDLDEEAVEERLPAGLPPEGAFVEAVYEGSPAAIGGVLAGDIIIMINGKSVPTARHLQKFIADSAIGVAIPLRIIRGRMVMELHVVPSALPR